jgi:hypothetical protein
MIYHPRKRSRRMDADKMDETRQKSHPGKYASAGQQDVNTDNPYALYKKTLNGMSGQFGAFRGKKNIANITNKRSVK